MKLGVVATLFGALLLTLNLSGVATAAPGLKTAQSPTIDLISKGGALATKGRHGARRCGTPRQCRAQARRRAAQQRRRQAAKRRAAQRRKAAACRKATAAHVPIAAEKERLDRTWLDLSYADPPASKAALDAVRAEYDRFTPVFNASTARLKRFCE